jgi:hypothetical protein
MITPINQRPQCPAREEGIFYEVNSIADLAFFKSIRNNLLFTLLNNKGGKGVNQEHYQD